MGEVVTMMIQETVVEIAERFPIEREAIGTDNNHIHLRCSAHPKWPQAFERYVQRQGQPQEDLRQLRMF